MRCRQGKGPTLVAMAKQDELVVAAKMSSLGIKGRAVVEKEKGC